MITNKRIPVLSCSLGIQSQFREYCGRSGTSCERFLTSPIFSNLFRESFYCLEDYGCIKARCSLRRTATNEPFGCLITVTLKPDEL
jgi:hypothetical protein